VTAQALTRTRRYSFVPITQCAWCSGISVLGRYVHIPAIGKVSRRLIIPVPVIGQMEVGMSHGICPACYSKVCREAAAR
jgi:hypothetical protein